MRSVVINASLWIFISLFITVIYTLAGLVPATPSRFVFQWVGTIVSGYGVYYLSERYLFSRKDGGLVLMLAHPYSTLEKFVNRTKKYPFCFIISWFGTKK